MRMTRTGITRTYGGNLRRVLNRALDNRMKALCSGFGVTVLLQSSTATCLMTATFAGHGLLPTASALAVMLGADVGTTIVAQIFTFKIDWLSPFLLVTGLILFQVAKQKRNRDLGRLCIGLGLLILALRMVVSVSAPIQTAEPILAVLTSLSTEPVLAVLMAAILTWITHSSLATILLIASLSPTIPPALILPLVLGANLGGALPAISATWGAPPVARRVALGNAAFKLVGCIALLPFLGSVETWLLTLDPDPVRFTVNFHLAFNLALVLIFLPFTGIIAEISERLLPDTTEIEDPSVPRYLEPLALTDPVVALTNAAREALRMVDVLDDMLRMSLDVLYRDDPEKLRAVTDNDDTVDDLYAAIKLYLVKLSREPLGENESRRCNDVMSFVTNLEHVGDILDKNVMELAAKKIKYRLSFSDQGLAEIKAMHGHVQDNLKLAANVFISEDRALARKLLTKKDAFREMERSAAESHHKRLRTGLRDSLETSALHLDILRDLKRINSHLCSAAYPILEESGDLRRSRLEDNS